ncbi:hypothetical protein TEA_002781 [Camellia sinensis var. sinensis]|uniref:Alpha-1,4 glucan phosphorylase n=1 Tax=Camellia sinensis var. sinensis TaxID=542762 RepID=A0A4S4D0N1_CAMSN|nr:hypothetical protein TEA_002781 [Camellia sinensis var. sinensis]
MYLSSISMYPLKLYFMDLGIDHQSNTPSIDFGITQWIPHHSSTSDQILQICGHHSSTWLTVWFSITEHTIHIGIAIDNTNSLQEKDAALGNGGLGRLASCFLDSMPTLNLPAWGVLSLNLVGIVQKFSHWEVVRHDIVFPVRFFGQVEVHPSGSRKWVGGEVAQALAYDVPIPGYKTKNTINLHLWEAKAGAKDFNLFQFNDGQYESAAQLHSRAQQERKDGKSSWQWSKFPNKVALQLNDTHSTLAIPELMRLLMDDDGLGWDEAWDVTTRTIAYTNHTVLPEALEKCSQAVMWKLLPHHMEIIEEIDKRVNGVAQLHSDILKSELFADYVSIWPKKFQNKTNDFQAEWESAKMDDKQRLAQFIFQVTGVSIDPNSLFDSQFKWIHEYKRQLLNILGAIYRYKKLKGTRS